MNKDCKRFGKGSIFENMDCMLCDDCSECNFIAHKAEIEFRKEKAVNELCKECGSIGNCKAYDKKHRCDYKYMPSSKKLGQSRCEDCRCYYQCIKKYNGTIELECVKDINVKTTMFGWEMKYTKGNKYKFIAIYYRYKEEEFMALYDTDKNDFITYDFTSILINYLKPSLLLEMEKAVEDHNNKNK